MYELIDIGGGDFYIDCPSKMGIITDKNDAWLVDSGGDADAGRKVLKHITERGWTLRAIINTHAHADHIGGNAFLKKRTGCAIYAPGIDAAIAAHTLLNPAILYGGYPPQPLRHKFFVAPPEIAEDISRAALPAGMEILPLPGHSPSQIGVKSPSGAWFIGDAVMGADTVEKYGVTYVCDIAAHLSSLDTLKNLRGRMFIPSHAQPTDDIAPLAEVNDAAVRAVIARTLAFCQSPQSFDDILKAIFDEYKLVMNIAQYALVGSTVKSYLAYMCDRAELIMTFEGNVARWGSS